jgi:hypothetical protein
VFTTAYPTTDDAKIGGFNLSFFSATCTSVSGSLKGSVSEAPNSPR